MKRAASFLVALLVAVAHSPAAADDGHGALLSGYTMTSWTLADGIPIGPVSAMVQDKEGYLWLGTTSGVVRFDGARFTPWNSLYPSPLPRREVLALALSRDGTFWVGFARNGDGVSVGAWRHGVLTLSTTGSAPLGPTTSILEDQTGCVWAVSDGALHRWRRGRWDVVRDGALGRATVVSVREAGGTIWIGTRHGVFRTRDGEVFELVEPGIARETSQSADGTLWMTDPVHGARRQGALAASIGLEGWGMRLLHDSRGNLWVGTTGQGLWRVRNTSTADTPRVERATIQTGLSSDLVQTLLEDRDGNIWVGTMLGLHSLTPQELTPLASGALVRATLPEPDNSVWVGTASGLMQFRHAGGAWRGRTVSDRWDIQSLFRDARGQAWAKTDHGVRLLARGRLVQAPTPSVVDPPCSDGSLNVATAPDPAALPRPSCAAHDGTWAAIDGVLTVRRGETVNTIPSTASPETGPQRVDAIFEDAAGTIWAGGTAGLWRIREGRAEQLGAHEGLPAQRVMAITQSLDGDLWLAVDRGPLHAGRRSALVRLKPADIDRAIAGKAPVAGYKIYDAENGLAGVPLGMVTAARSSDGSLWFTIGGSLTVVDPRQVSDGRYHRAPDARIAAVTIDDRPVPRASAGGLPPRTRKIQIDYTAVQLTAPRRVRFRYRLDGFDPGWVDAGPRRQAYYTNLAPGSYVFRVQANGDSDTWAAQEAQWAFAVRPAFHQTGWFYALCATALMLAAWGAAQTRVWILNRQFAATLAERTRLSREIHDTMLQSLVGIALQVQAIARRSSPEGSEQQSQLVALRRQVEQLVREARQAIQDLRSPLLEARGLAGSLAEIGRRTVGPTVSFDVTADQIAGVSAATEGELLRIAQEAITNAARHADATRIHVELGQERERVRLRVTDDGRGFDVNAMLASAGHYGLTGMTERAARIGGNLRVQSSAGGTVVEAIVPCVRLRS